MNGTDLGLKPAALAPPGWLGRLAAALLIALTVVLGVGAGATSAWADPEESSTTTSDTEEITGDMSFYALASATATFFGNSMSPDFDAGKGKDGKVESMWQSLYVDAASGGSLLGYSDSNRDEASNWLQSRLTVGSSTTSYAALQAPAGEGSSFISLVGPLSYAQYGGTLAALGLDKSTSGMSMNLLPMIGGLVLLALYTMAYWVNQLFALIIDLLRVTNPFELFRVAVSTATGTDAFNWAEGAGETSVGGAWTSLASTLSGWYEIVYRMGWAVMFPLFLGITLMGLVIMRKQNWGSPVRKLLIRMVYMGVGLPLLASMYTGTLNSMKEQVSGPNDKPTQAVVQNFVDFENWMMNTSLRVPDGVSLAWDERQNRPTVETIAGVRDTARKINEMSSPGMKTIYSGGDNGVLDPVTGEQVSPNVVVNAAERFAATTDLLTRWMRNDRVASSDYETAVVSSLAQKLSSASVDDREKVTSWFRGFEDRSTKDLNDPEKKWKPKDSSNEYSMQSVMDSNRILRVAGNTGLQAAHNNGIVTFTSSNAGGGATSQCYAEGLTELSRCNLSPLASYNWLNSTFAPESFTVYSSEKSTSEFTRNVHRSVNLVGGAGLSAGANYLSAMVILACFVLVGLFYGIGMLMANFRRTFQLVTAVPFAALGSLSGISKMVIYTMALIIEVLVTVFLFMLMQEFIMALPDIISTPVEAMARAIAAVEN